MVVVRYFIFLAITCLLGFAPLAADDGFRRARPGYEFQFPRDHGSHPDFKTEWWYFTGNVTGDSGEQLGYNLTIFRSAQMSPGIDNRTPSSLLAEQIYLGHFAITNITEGRHFSTERIGREGLGQASASTEKLDVRLNDWSITMDDEEVITIIADYKDSSIHLRLAPEKPFIIHGKDGAHKKAADPGQASHYISYTRLATKGTIVDAGKTLEVNGYSWMDHEFGSAWLSKDEVGWDWFAIQLENGEDLMLYQLRRADGSFTPQSSGSMVSASGASEEITADDFHIDITSHWISPRTNARYPAGWVIDVPKAQGSLVVTPALPDQEMMTDRYTGAVYWEGAVRVHGDWRGKKISGKGYVELVGYADIFNLLADRQ